MRQTNFQEGRPADLLVSDSSVHESIQLSGVIVKFKAIGSFSFRVGASRLTGFFDAVRLRYSLARP